MKLIQASVLALIVMGALLLGLATSDPAQASWTGNPCQITIQDGEVHVHCKNTPPTHAYLIEMRWWPYYQEFLRMTADEDSDRHILGLVEAKLRGVEQGALW